MRLFISYGHGDYPDFFEALITDLRKNHNVWTDHEIRLGDNWVFEIDEAISHCDIFIFVKSKQSVRPDSYCFGEIAFAREHYKKIAVLSLDNTPTPSIVSGMQRLDMSQAIDIEGLIDAGRYNSAIEMLLHELRRVKDTETETSVALQLFSFDNSNLLNTYGNHTVLPDVVVSRIRCWLNESSDYFAVFGNAASGKSTLSTAVYNEVENSVIHFFRYSDVKTLDARWYLQHIISSLTKRNLRFKAELEKEDFERTQSSLRPEQLLSDFLVNPLKRAGETVLIILDGFDEVSDRNRRKEFVELFFGEEFRQNKYGETIKLFITSRNDRELKSILTSMGAVIVSDFEKENIAAAKNIVRNYLCEHHYEYTEEVFERIYSQSGGDFLYIKFILDEIRTSGKKEITDIRFPLGMKGVCQRHFDRIFENENYYEDVAAPVLEVLVSVKTPVSVDVLQRICEIDRRELRKLLKKLEMFVDVKSDHVTFVHKSLFDWLVANEIMDKYYVDCDTGKEKLCEYSKTELQTADPSQYAREYGLHHLFEANRYDDIIGLMQKCDRVFCSIFLSFIIELVSDERSHLIPKLFDGYIRQVQGSDYLTAETLRILIQFGKDADASKVVHEFKNLKDVQFFSDWTAFHRAKRRNESTSSLLYFANSLLGQTAEPIIIANLKRTIADIVREQGQYDKAESLYESVLKISYENDLYSVYNDCEFALIDLLFVRGRLDSAWERLNRLNENHVILGGQLENYRYHRLRGHLFHIVGNIKDALCEHSECLRIAEELHFPLRQMSAANSCAESAPNHNTGIGFLKISRRLFDEHGLNRLEYGKSFYIESELLINDNRYEQAKEAADMSIHVLTDVGYAGGIAHAHLERGKARCFLNEYEGAISDLKTALDYYREKKTRPRFRFEAYAYLLKSADKLGIVNETVLYDDISYFSEADYPFLKDMLDYVEKIRRREFA